MDIILHKYCFKSTNQCHKAVAIVILLIGLIIWIIIFDDVDAASSEEVASSEEIASSEEVASSEEFASSEEVPDSGIRNS